MRIVHVYHEGPFSSPSGMGLSHSFARVLANLDGPSTAPSIRLVHYASLTELEAALGDIEILVPTAPVRGVSFSHASKLRLIHSLGAGMDEILPAPDLPEHVLLAGARGIFAAEVAEHTIALLLSMARAMPTHWKRQSERRWSRHASCALEGKRLGILGTGEIGCRVARIGAAMGMRLSGLRRTTSGSMAPFERLFDPTSLQAFLAELDYLVVAVPLTPATHTLVGERELASLPQGACVIHISRGGVVDEAALVQALESGHLGGAALDVFTTEPLPSESPLWDIPNLLVTPHVAGFGVGYADRALARVVRNVAALDAGYPLEGLVNKAAGY